MNDKLKKKHLGWVFNLAFLVCDFISALWVNCPEKTSLKKQKLGLKLVGEKVADIVALA